MKQTILFIDFPRHKTLSAAKKMKFRSVVLKDSSYGGIGSICEDQDKADEIFTSNLRDARQILSSIRKNILPYHAVRAIITHNEVYIDLAALLAEALNLPGHLSYRDAVSCRDKYLMRRRFKASAINVPKFSLIGTKDDLHGFSKRVGFPIIVKPRRGTASAGVTRVDNGEDLGRGYMQCKLLGMFQHSYKKNGNKKFVLAEEYIAGIEVAVEALMYRGMPEVILISDKPNPLVGPYFEESIYATPSALDPAIIEHIESLTKKIVSCFGIKNGPAHIEYRIKGKEVFPLEIAARTGSSFKYLSMVFGRPFDEINLNYLLGLANAVKARACNSGKHFGYSLIQATAEGAFSYAEGLFEAKTVPGIVGIDIFKAKGERIVKFPNFNGYIGTIYGTGDSRDGLLRSLRAAHERLRIKTMEHI